jgi:diguanylate cyclase (GGDEF)-like protein
VYLIEDNSEDLENVAQGLAEIRDGIAQHENEIKRLAYWDALTELPNRIQFTALLKDAVSAHPICYVLMMDLDRFRLVNDIMGHEFGDVLLKRVADRLREALPNTQLARLGGDEFAVLLCNADLNLAKNTAQTILTLLEQPITIDEQAIDLSVGIGIAGFPEHGEDANMLMRQAEVAMYAAKRQAGSYFMVYRSEIDRGSQQNLSLMSELRHAIQQNQLKLYIQPKFDLTTKKVVGAEALVRWVHPTLGFLVPDDFIMLAEQTGVIRLLTKWVVEKSAQLCHALTARKIDLKISINVSTHDLLDLDLPTKFAEILQRHQVAPSSIYLEITESAIMSDPVRAQHTLYRLSAMGIELSIDDFGVGYSSLTYLKRLPVKELKIDKSFVLHMNRNGDDRAIVRSIIDLGHNMGLRVVAEGVETPETLRLLTEARCDQVQGNYINQPIPAEDFVAWLVEGSIM